VTDDIELLDAWRAGSQEAGNELFQRHFASVRRFFRNKLSSEDMEDLLQRTFLACVEGRERFRGDSSFRTYLFAVARRTLYRHFEKRRSDAVGAGLDFSVSSLHDLGASPSQVVAASEQQGLVLEALRRIPVDMQLMVELSYWEGLTGPEIAQVLGIAQATVRTRLHRARARLKQEIERLWDADASLVQVEDWTRSLRDLG
jgi:RNA polymerase sigma-70 factor (ECF subfamily)